MVVESFGGCAPAEGLAWPTVECGGDSSELVGVPAGEVGALREVLAQQPVRVLVRFALPRAVGVSEEDRDAGFNGERGVCRQFLAPVPGQQAAQLLGLLSGSSTSSHRLTEGRPSDTMWP